MATYISAPTTQDRTATTATRPKRRASTEYRGRKNSGTLGTMQVMGSEWMPHRKHCSLLPSLGTGDVFDLTGLRVQAFTSLP